MRVEKTLLEYVIEIYLGPPSHRSRDGRATWNCPFHDDTNPSFCTMPPHPKHKNRYICFGCNARGDIFDLLKEMEPGENFGERKGRVEYYKAAFEKDHASSSPRGDGEVEDVRRSIEEADRGYRPIRPAEAYGRLMKTFEEWETSEANALQILKEIVRVCDDCNISVYHLLDRWDDYREIGMDLETYNKFPATAPPIEAD